MNEIIYIISAAIALLSACAWSLRIFYHVCDVSHWEHVVLYKHGELVRLLVPGRNRFWGLGYSVRKLDSRFTQFVVQGQDFLTADHAGVKLTAVARYRIADPAVYLAVASKPEAELYAEVQLALRDVIGGATLTSLIDRKSDFGPELLEKVMPLATKLGLEVEKVALRDLILAGEIRRIYTEALTAREESKIKLERARAEAAAIRTLANAARVFETHPALLQLKFLEALEKADGGISQPLTLGTASHWLEFLKK